MSRPHRALLAATALSLLAGAGCSSSEGAAPDTSSPGAATSTTEGAAPAAPEGPAAALEPIAGPGAPFMGSATGFDLAAADWEQHELIASGTATAYRSDGALPADGSFDLQPADEAPYRTRILVRRPSDPAEFSGTVVVEWLNVSGGLDADPDFGFLAPELVRAGHAWVGVSAQQIGVEGGPTLVTIPGLESMVGSGLKGIDPDRYGTLAHPGDAFAYDIYTQVARAVRDPQSTAALDGLEAEVVIAAGESQSGFALTTYANGVQPLVQQFDGFLIHSRGGPAMPLGSPGEAVDLASSIVGEPTAIRTDLEVPVLMLITESDLGAPLGFAAARQPDTDRIRTWEVAGTAHVDRSVLGALEPVLGCGAINAGPHRFTVRAALVALRDWIGDGEPPATGEPIGFVDGEVQRDPDGIAAGGIRTPQVEVPTEVFSSRPGGSDLICLLAGSTTDLPEPAAASRYGSAEAYLERYEAATDDAIEAGFLLAADRDEILADARPDLVTG